MKTFNDFSELPGAESITNIDGTDAFNISFENMSPKFGTVPPLGGYRFGMWSNEDGLGGKLEPPHIHAQIGKNNEAGKFWLEDGSTGRVSVDPDKTKGIPVSKHRDFEKHIEAHKQECFEEWDAWIVKNSFQSKMNPTELKKFNERQQKRQ